MTMATTPTLKCPVCGQHHPIVINELPTLYPGISILSCPNIPEDTVEFIREHTTSGGLGRPQWLRTLATIRKLPS
jgi:hypothetical protein